MSRTATKPDRLQEAHERLARAVESITSSDEWKRMLKVASKFHRYSSGGITYSKLLNSSWLRASATLHSTCAAVI